MAPQDDLTAERAAQLYGSLTCTTYREGYQDPENDIALIAEELKTTRQAALREAASKLGIGDSSGLLDAPCLWCGYNGRGYYQVGTHDKSCIWHTVGGRNERLDRLASEGG